MNMIVEYQTLWELYNPSKSMVVHLVECNVLSFDYLCT